VARVFQTSVVVVVPAVAVAVAVVVVVAAVAFVVVAAVTTTAAVVVVAVVRVVVAVRVAFATAPPFLVATSSASLAQLSPFVVVVALKPVSRVPLSPSSVGSALATPSLSAQPQPATAFSPRRRVPDSSPYAARTT